jgi:hypothetical protein
LFQHQCQLDICGSLKQLFSRNGAYMHGSIVNLLIKKRMLMAKEHVLLRKKSFKEKKSGFMNELGRGREGKGGGQYS